MKSLLFYLPCLSPLRRLLILLAALSAFLPESHAQEVTSLTLVNATTDTDIRPLKTKDTINLAQTGTFLNIRANPGTSKVGSVVFGLDGNGQYRIESTVPYVLQGDNGGNYNSWTPTIGTHLITATPFSATGGGGTKGTGLSITIVVINQPVDTTGSGTYSIALSGELKKWHKITLSIKGPQTDENAANNPFLNYRLNVTFTNGGSGATRRSYSVPGYFAADGKAAESGATAGNVWRVHFAPDSIGSWTYTVSMRSGPNVVISDDPNAGNPVVGINGKTGSFNVGPTDKSGLDHRGKGRLRYVGEHYLQYAETGEYFVKGGVDSPENFLAYQDFDNTPNIKGYRKSWGPHLQDWHSGDATWRGNKGKGIIGAINYLSEQGLSSFSFIPFTIQGDDRGVYPYVTDTDFTRLDCSKLDQWEIVFEHADKKGLYLHFKTQEIENCKVLDGGQVGLQRKLYYRELIARFAHHLALNWNLGEENIQTEQQRRDMAQYFYDHDPYHHLIVLHNQTNLENAIYTKLLGEGSKLTGVSLQIDKVNVYAKTLEWVQKSGNAGKKWVVANDEQPSALEGVSCDADYQGNRGTVADNQEEVRREVLWGNLMAGGGGVEYYFGYQTGQTDLSAQDFRSRAKMWGFTRHALHFFRTYLPFQEMKPLSNSANVQVLGKEGQIYAVYLKFGGSTLLKLDTEGTYSVQWYDPRNGGSLQQGSVSGISGSGLKSIGNPPENPSQDWVALITRTGGQQVVSFTLVDADTDLDLQTLSNGANLNLATLQTKNLNIRATTSPVTVGSVVFNLTGQEIRDFTDGAAPYALFDDINGNYDVWVPAVGSYTLNGTPFSAVAGGGTAGTALTINFTVIDQPISNQAPVVSNPIPDQTATEGVAYSFSFATNTFTDPEGGALTYSASLSDDPELPGWLSFNATNRTFSGAPPSGSTSPLSIQVTASDGQQEAANTTFTLTLIPNQAPVVSNPIPDQTATEGVAYSFSFAANTFTDPEGSAISYLATLLDDSPLPVWLSFNATSHTFSGTAPKGSVSPLSIKVTASDSQLKTSTTFTLTNRPAPNKAPVVSNVIPNQTATVGVIYNFSFAANTFTDPEGSTLTYSASLPNNLALPTWLSFNATTRTFSGTPLSGSASPLSIQVTASDGKLPTSTSFSLTVNAPATGQRVVSFSLVNADTDKDLQPLSNGASLNLATLTTKNLNIRANTNPAKVGSVVFILTGPLGGGKQIRNFTEGVAPYTLFGDINGNYNAWVPAVGTFSLKATPFSAGGGVGTAGSALTISFTVINQAAVGMASEALPVVHPRLLAYPNPLSDGRFKVWLSEAFQGAVSYVLVSQSGIILTQGQLTLNQPESILPFDLSRQMGIPGVYYLRLDGKNLKGLIKLERQ